jgi:hypothetical protein
MVQHIYGNASVLTVTIVEYVCQRIENAIIWKMKLKCLKRLLQAKLKKWNAFKTIWPKESGITSPCLHRQLITVDSLLDQLHSYKEELLGLRFWIGIKEKNGLNNFKPFF